MNTFQLNITDGLAVITLDRGRSNPINHAMVKELMVCINDLNTNTDVDGLILTGKEGFFSSGVDLIEAYEYNEEQIRSFWTDFLQLQKLLVSFSKPLIAAISGHAPAGGCILAICCDYRVMSEGAHIIGLNEVPVGIIVPDSVFSLYAFWLGQRTAYQSLMEGRLFRVNEALQTGLIDEVTSAETLMEVAIKKAKIYRQFNPITWRQSKVNLRKELISKLGADQNETLDQMLQQWWAPATRKGLAMMIHNLKSKNS